MTTEKVSVEQAMQRLSEASINHNKRMSDLEQKITEICTDKTQPNQNTTQHISTELTILENNMIERMGNMQVQTQEWQTNTIVKLNEGQQQWNSLTDEVRDMKTEIQKITATIIANLSSNNIHQTNEDSTSAPYTYQTTSTPNRITVQSASITSKATAEQHHNQHTSEHQTTMPPNAPIVHTVVVPPTSAIPIFHGKPSESPRQFLIRIKQYTQTVHQWNESSLLNGIGQFLRDTALEWYCQSHLTHSQPQTWAEFVVLFLAQFNSPIRRARQEQEWRECRQRENETINEFLVRLRTLWTEQKPNETEADLIKHLMCKMRNDLLTMIGVSKWESLDEMILEAQRIEEILYRRLKYHRQSNSIQQTTSYANIHPTTKYDEDDQYELQTMSAHETNRLSKTHGQTRYRAQKTDNTTKPTHYTNYSSTSNNSRRQAPPYNESKCFTCGIKGHFTRNCPYLYNNEQQQQTWYSQKNDNGAHGGRDYSAPQ